jgi:hypothetical protein
MLLYFVFQQKMTKQRQVYGLCLHGMQVTLAYLLMLAAMTYSIELFVMTVMGLTTGHAFFNRKETPRPSADPCCPDDMNQLVDDLENIGVSMLGESSRGGSQEYQKII